MKPANFPERKRIRQVEALRRNGEAVPKELLVSQIGVRTKKSLATGTSERRTHHSGFARTR